MRSWSVNVLTEGSISTWTYTLPTNNLEAVAVDVVVVAVEVAVTEEAVVEVAVTEEAVVAVTEEAVVADAMVTTGALAVTSLSSSAWTTARLSLRWAKSVIIRQDLHF